MDNEQKKQSMILMLNDISKNIDMELITIKKEIENLNETIQEEIEQLKETTSEIVVNEDSIRENEKEMNELSSKEESLSSELRSLESQINEMKSEIDDLHRKIKEQLPKLDAGSIIERILNPLSAIKEIIDALNNDIKECEQRIKFNMDTINQRSNEAETISKDRMEIENKIQCLKQSIDQLNMTRERLEQSVKQLGIEKTNSENLKLKFEQLQSKCKLLLDQVATEKDLVDMEIDSEITDFVKRVNTALSNVKNGATINCGNSLVNYIDVNNYLTV